MGSLEIADDGENRLEVHYAYFPATPHQNMTGRIEDAEPGEPARIEAVNMIAIADDGNWVAIHDLLEDLPGFDSGKLIAHLLEKEEGR